jgi:hypothetical protein
MSQKPINLEVLPPAPEMKLPAIIPKLKSGDDTAVGKQLVKEFNDAQTGMRRIVALGLHAWEIKESLLKHGEWGPWLAVNAPSLCRPDSVTGKPKASHALSNYMELTKGVLESVGFSTIGKYLEEKSKFPHGGNLKKGNFLLIADKQVPVEMKPLREKICALVDGKTQRQLFLEFKQAEEDENGGRKVKRGQLPGSKGLTKEMREKAAQRAEQERINELEETLVERIDWLKEIADAKNLGAMDSKLLKKFAEAADIASGFAKRVLEARKEGGQA